MSLLKNSIKDKALNRKKQLWKRFYNSNKKAEPVDKCRQAHLYQSVITTGFEINVSDVNGDADIAVIVNSTKADGNGGISKPVVITD